MKQTLGLDVELIKGSGGIFEVRVGDAVVARKTPEAGFPNERQVVAAVQGALESRA